MIFVTGGNGFLGSHLLLRLATQDRPVTAVKREGSSLLLCEKIFRLYNAEERFKKINWINGDVTDYFFLEEALNGAEHVYHCAAVVSFLKKDKRKMDLINVQGTANMVNASLHAGVKKFCHVSSIATLGRNTATGLFDEETLWEVSPHNSNYSKSKWKAELEVWRGIAEGLNAVIVNPAVILGPGEWKQGSAALFKLVADGLKYYTEGVNGYVDVKDVAVVMQRLMESDVSGERFVVSAEDLSYKELFTLMAEHLKKKPPHRRLSPGMAQAAQRAESVLALLTGRNPRVSRENVITAFHEYRYSNKKIISTLNYQFTPVSETIRESSGLLLQGF